MNTVKLSYRFVNSLVAIVIVLTFVACGNSKEVDPVNFQNENKRAFRTTFHQANSEKMIGHTENAIELFNKCISINPKSSACHFALSELYSDQNNTEKAIEYGRQAYDLNPKNKWYAQALGELYFNSGDYFNSTKYFEKVVIEFGDKNLDTRSKLTQSYIFSNQKEKAIEQLNRIELEDGKAVITSVTKHDLFVELNQPKEAKKEIEELLDAYQNSIEIPTQTMDYFLQTRQFEMAKLSIDHIQKINPEDGNALIGLAEIELYKNNITETFKYLERGLESEEIDAERKLMLLESLATLGFDIRFKNSREVNKKMSHLFEKSYEKESENERFLLLYGQYLLNNNKIDSAIIMFSKSVELAPADFNAWMSLLDANYLSEHYKELVARGQNAVELFPSQPLVYLLLGVGYYETNQYDKAEEIFFMGKELVVNDNELKEEFNYHSAKNLWQQGDKEAANQKFNQLFTAVPKNDKFYFGYASLLKEADDNASAIKYVKKAVELEQRNPEYYFLYATLLFENKEYELSEQMISRAVNQDVTNSEYIEFLGNVTYLLGDIEKAVEIWEEAYRIKPSLALKNKIDTKSYNE